MRVGDVYRELHRRHQAGQIADVAVVIRGPDRRVSYLVSDGFPISDVELARRLSDGVPELVEGDVTTPVDLPEGPKR